MCLKDQTYLTHTLEDPFLEIDVKGGEREHIKAYHMGEKAHLSFSRCLLATEERSHMPLRGERHVK